MIKLFEIPIYALSRKSLNDRVGRRVAELEKFFVILDPDAKTRAIGREVIPMRSWEYNHIVGYICIDATKQDLLFDVFLPIPVSTKYFWNSKTKYFVQSICANGAHIYLDALKTNEKIREAVTNMLDFLIAEHIPSRFHVDREAFNTVNEHLDYLGIIDVVNNTF
jgi:hypothetical protein